MGGSSPLGTVTSSLGLTPDIPKPPTPQSYAGPGGTQAYNPITGQYTFVPNTDATAAQSDQLAQLYRSHLLGGGYEPWQENLQGRIADIESQLASSGSTADVPGGIAGLGAAALGRQGLLGQDLLTPEEIEGLQQELEGLQGLVGMEDPGFAFGALGRPSQERLTQIGEQTATLEDILGERVTESQRAALADLARRGVTGGTAEFDLAEKTAEARAGAAQQAVLFGEQLRQADEAFKMNLLNQIEQGLSGRAAQALAEQQLIGGQALAQQQLADQRAYNQALMEQQSAMALQNLAMNLGAGYGLNFLGGGGLTPAQNQAYGAFQNQQQTQPFFLNRFY